MKVWWEKWWPYIVSVILSSIVFIQIDWYLSSTSAVDKLLTNSLKVNTSMLAFYLTIYTLMKSVSTRRMQFVIDSGGLPRLEGFLMGAIIWQFVSITTIIISPFLSEISITRPWLRWVMTVQSFIVFIAWAVSIRFVRIFIYLLGGAKGRAQKDS